MKYVDDTESVGAAITPSSNIAAANASARRPQLP